MEKVVSIIVPVYNAERYLHRCIQSILNQSYKNWEAIFVNDGSTDSSLSILQEYTQKDTRIRIINKNNGGAASARNAGLDALRTIFFTFLDADDSYSPNFLDKTIEAAINNTCDLVVTDINFQGNAIGLLFSGMTNINPFQYIKCVHVGTFAKLYRSSIINTSEHKLRFPEDMMCAEDVVFSVSYATRIKSLYAIQEPMYNYHYDSEGSLSHRLLRLELPLEQYMYCVEAPWRIYRNLADTSSIEQSRNFSQWAHALYNELWKMYYSYKKRFSDKESQKKISAHFRLRHKDFVSHVSLWKRLSAPQRHPRLLKVLRFIWRTCKRVFVFRSKTV